MGDGSHLNMHSNCPLMNYVCCLCRWALVLWQLTGRQGQAGRHWYDAPAGPFFWSWLVTSCGRSTGFWRYNMLVCHRETPYSQPCTGLTHLTCFVILNSMRTVMEWTARYLVFFPLGLHWPFDSMDIFVPDKCSQMTSCLSKTRGRFIQHHMVFQHKN